MKNEENLEQDDRAERQERPGEIFAGASPPAEDSPDAEKEQGAEVEEKIGEAEFDDPPVDAERSQMRRGTLVHAEEKKAATDQAAGKCGGEKWA